MFNARTQLAEGRYLKVLGWVMQELDTMQRHPVRESRQMHRSLGLLTAVVTLTISVYGAGAKQDRPVRAVGDAPTFNQDVAAILHRRCVACHRPGQPAPMPLRAYGEVRPWISAIRREVASGRMPPWPADSRFGRFANDLRLSAEELATILRWIDAGGSEGWGAAPTPSMLQYAWTHPSGRPPDVVLELPDSVEVPPSTRWPTFNVYSKQPDALRGEDHFVEAVQLLPGNRRVTHHSSLSTRHFPSGVSLGTGRPWPGGPLLSGLPILTDPAAFGRSSAPPATPSGAFSSGGVTHLAFYFPGNDGFVMYPPAAGKRVPAGDYFEWSLHYTPSDSAESDRHVAGLWLHRRPPAQEVITLRVGDFHIVNGAEVVLPAGLLTNPGHAAIVDVPDSCDGRPCTRPVSMLPPIEAAASNWRITGVTPVLEDIRLFSASPHGHLRLKDMTYVVTYPDGRESTVLHVPRYDFKWQFVYRFETALRIPAGSTIKVLAHYDNSSANRFNPDASRPVQWSEQSTDEMFNGFIDLAIDRFGTSVAPADPSLSPARPLVVAAGCAITDADGRWLLVRATTPARTTIGHADAGEMAATRRTPDQNRYLLLGAADFTGPDESLTAGDRATYLSRNTTNATGLLVRGRSVAVKGVLVGEVEPAINLVSVWPVPGRCP